MSILEADLKEKILEWTRKGKKWTYENLELFCNDFKSQDKYLNMPSYGLVIEHCIELK